MSSIRAQYQDGLLFLLHTRLAIIDLSDRATQPMSSADGRYHIVFNGEIYNYQDLRQRLTSKGHSFRTTSDTEVLLYLYVEYQEQITTLLTACSALRSSTRFTTVSLPPADRFGEKAFARLQGGTFCFASTLRALLLLPGGSSEVNLESILFLCWGNIAPDQSMFKGVQRTFPSHEPHDGPGWCEHQALLAGKGRQPGCRGRSRNPTPHPKPSGKKHRSAAGGGRAGGDFIERRG